MAADDGEMLKWNRGLRLANLSLISAVEKIISTRGTSTIMQPTEAWWASWPSRIDVEFILTTIWGSFPQSFHQVVVSNEQTQGYPTRPAADPV